MVIKEVIIPSINETFIKIKAFNSRNVTVILPLKSLEEQQNKSQYYINDYHQSTTKVACNEIYIQRIFSSFLSMILNNY